MNLEGLRGLFRPQASPELPGEPVSSPTLGAALRATAERLGARWIEDDLATASGLALAGARVAVHVAGERLADHRHRLREAARRRVPLVVHARVDAASADGHAGLHAVLDSGAFVALAADPQEAVDLAVIARVVAELALVPGIVAYEAGADEAQELLLPAPAFVERLVGGAGDDVPCPTSAQQMLFGETRRRVPRWFDPQRPVSLPPDSAAIRPARELFFDEALPQLVAEAANAFAAATGRDLAFLGHRAARAKRALVTAGAAARVADGLEDVHRIALRWLRPFPEARLREALNGCEAVIVVEAGDGAMVREVRAAVAGRCRVAAAFYRGALDAAALAAATRADRDDSLWLGVPPPRGEAPGLERFPRQQVLVQRVQRELPELAERLIPGGAAATAAAAVSADVPSLIRRFAHARPTYDSVARFWGELMHPLEAGAAASPDPYQALGAMPACTAAFHDQSGGRERLPVFDAGRCTGCGACWTLCPDSALAPVAIATAALLDAASARLDGYPAKLKRGHRAIAGRADAALAAAGARRLDGAILRQAFDEQLPKMKLDEGEDVAFRAAFEGLAEGLGGLPLAATEAFFHAPHRASAGSGELLLVAVSPQACQGCGLCAWECPEDAFQLVPESAETRSAARRVWQAWEELPDTPGSSIARAAELAEVGPLPALLLSRHCLFSTAGGDPAEPGSGQRLAVRQLTAVAELQLQRALVAHLDALRELGERLRDAIRQAMTQALPIADLESLDEALGEASDKPANLGAVVDRLAGLGQKPGVDAGAVRRLARSAREIEALRDAIAAGAEGAGRARFGLVCAGPTVARWAAAFPRNPFGVPVVASLDGEAAALALGLAEGLAGQRLAEVRARRRAEARLAAPPDLAVQERAIDALGWDGLTDGERALCPPVVVIADREGLGGGALSRLLAGRWPVKVVLLDDRDLRAGEPDPTLLALAHRRAFVLASSVAHPGHLYEGFGAALAFPGPAFVHLHAPSPARHGFDTDLTAERARQAVEHRVHPLLRYDPRREGVFGLRLDLDGNPSPASAWAAGADGEPRTPAAWAAGEARFAGADLAGAEADRRHCWATLQELAGVVTPFTERLEQEIEGRVAERHRGELEALRREHAARLAAAGGVERTAIAARLRERLLQLAGHGEPS